MRFSAVWRSSAALAILAAGAAGAAPTPAPTREPLTLDTLMRHMAATRGVVAEFREVKELAILDVPLESRGTLYFVPPDRLVRRTTSPDRTSLTVDRGRVRYRDTAGDEDLDLSSNPIARHLVENMIVLFSGDLAALRARYAVRFDAEGRRWRLVLTPRGGPARRYVARVTLRGEGDAMRELVTVETDGDRTTTTFDRVEVDHRFTAAELAGLFAAARAPADP